MSGYVPCDGCVEEATHHLCEECCNEPTGDYARGVADERARVVADLRALCARFNRSGGVMWPGEVLAAMDGAKP